MPGTEPVELSLCILVPGAFGVDETGMELEEDVEWGEVASPRAERSPAVLALEVISCLTLCRGELLRGDLPGER